MTQTPIHPRPAATVILARDSDQGMEVFMLQRTHDAVFMPGAFVFPGGAVDEADGDSAIAQCCDLDAATANERAGVTEDGLAFLVAAVRECFEEAGLLLAHDRSGRPVAFDDEARAERFSGYRVAVERGELSLAELCRREDLCLSIGKLGLFSHWITPQGPPRRYDTRFFAAVAPPRQEASHDGSETIAQLWIRPTEALKRHADGRLELPSPTIRTLSTLAQFADTQELMEYATMTREVETNLPRLAQGSQGPQYFESDAPVYAELAKVDPDETGTASYEIVPGEPTRLSPTVLRVTAPNPSYMTGPGTNSYLVGTDALAVIDPGPDIDSHVQRLIELGAGRIRWILTTHTHMDHSPAARALKAATGAQVLGMPAPPHPAQDKDFQPDRVPEHNERLTLSDGVTLRMLHTPGHASNHLCFLLEGENILFSGDHIMQGSTVVIAPPDGDMKAYVESLLALHREEIDYIAPAHGFLLDAPYAVIDRIVSHRLAREAKVVRAMRDTGGGTLDELLPVVYGDVHPQLHRVASRSLLAHLLKLRDEARARESAEGVWRLTEATA